MTLNTGISEKHRKQAADSLSIFLADTYTLYLKTQNFHWNVTGPLFRSLHEMFEEQYNDLSAAVDVIAERIRALGFLAPGSFADYQKLQTIKDAQGELNAHQMLEQLVADHESLARCAREYCVAAEECHDSVTAGLLSERVDVHEKTAWMLRSMGG
jgi:starvation-inducible DNA-binding protein